MCGIDITVFHDDGTSEYEQLFSLLGEKAIVETLDENYLYTFKVLLNE